MIQEMVRGSVISGQKEGNMGRQRHRAERVIGKLREEVISLQYMEQ